MELEIKNDCSGVDWKTVSEILENVGMAHYEPDGHKKAFEASYLSVFVYHGSRLIGFGRAISDGIYQAALYDVAVLPEFQRIGIGKTILDNLLQRLHSCNVILYASPGKEDFYRKLGFRQMKTGMARFNKTDIMREKGFTD